MGSACPPLQQCVAPVRSLGKIAVCSGAYPGARCVALAQTQVGDVPTFIVLALIDQAKEIRHHVIPAIGLG